MKLGIIGTGLIVQEFLPSLLKEEGLEINALLSTPRSLEAAKKMAEDAGIALCTDSFEEFIASDIDTVYIAVPNFMHYSYSLQALEHKKNVIVEKPACSNYKEASKMAEAAKESGCFLFEAITTLHLGNYKKIREWLPRIGTIKLAQSQYSQYSRRYDAFRNGEVLPAFDPAKAGGAMMDLNLYNLHFILGLFGKPQNGEYYANIERGIDTSGIAVLDYGSFKALCIAAKDSKGFCGTVIQGTDGVIRTELAGNLIGKVTLELNDGTVEEYDDGLWKQRVVAEFRDFIQAVNTNDLAYRDEMIQKTLDVCEVQTELRTKAGIIFPMDN